MFHFCWRTKHNSKPLCSQQLFLCYWCFLCYWKPTEQDVRYFACKFSSNSLNHIILKQIFWDFLVWCLLLLDVAFKSCQTLGRRFTLFYFQKEFPERNAPSNCQTLHKIFCLFDANIFLQNTEFLACTDQKDFMHKAFAGKGGKMSRSVGAFLSEAAACPDGFRKENVQ